MKKLLALCLFYVLGRSYANAQQVSRDLTTVLSRANDTCLVIGLSIYDCVNCYYPFKEALDLLKQQQATAGNLLFLCPEVRKVELDKFVREQIPFCSAYSFLIDPDLFSRVVKSFGIKEGLFYFVYSKRENKVVKAGIFKDPEDRAYFKKALLGLGLSEE